MTGIIFKPIIKTQEEYDKITVENLIKDQRRAEALERLLKNNDFKEVIIKGFFTEYPLGKIKTSTSTMLEERICEQSLDQAKAPVYLAEYFNSIEQAGKNAKDSLTNRIKEERG